MKSKILINPEVLSNAHVPEEAFHRDKEISKLSNSIGLANTFIHGPVGSGKTLLLKQGIKDYNTKRGRAVYLDCSLYQTTNAVFRETLTALNRIVVSKSNYELTKRLKARLRRLDHPLTICLDHFDRLKEVETVNKFLSLGIKLVLVSDNFDSYRKLNAEAKANIANFIEISSYSTEQIFDILKDRAKQALEEYTYSEETLKKIARISCGNVTLALVLLKSLALKAENQNKKSIDDVELNYEANCPAEGLSRDERILLHILEERESLPSNRLYTFYTERARYPKSERSFRNYMESLCQKGLVKAVGEKRGRVYEIDEGHVQDND